MNTQQAEREPLIEKLKSILNKAYTLKSPIPKLVSFNAHWGELKWVEAQVVIAFASAVIIGFSWTPAIGTSSLGVSLMISLGVILGFIALALQTTYLEDKSCSNRSGMKLSSEQWKKVPLIALASLGTFCATLCIFLPNGKVWCAVLLGFLGLSYGFLWSLLLPGLGGDYIENVMSVFQNRCRELTSYELRTYVSDRNLLASELAGSLSGHNLKLILEQDLLADQLVALSIATGNYLRRQAGRIIAKQKNMGG